MREVMREIIVLIPLLVFCCLVFFYLDIKEKQQVGIKL